MFRFRLEGRAAGPTYGQLVRQVRRAIALGELQSGDQLPTVTDVASRLVLSPNTVLKAYRELEHAGLVQARAGAGTFITAASAPVTPHQARLRQRLAAWLADARAAGLTEEAIEALMDAARREAQIEAAG